MKKTVRTAALLLALLLLLPGAAFGTAADTDAQATVLTQAYGVSGLQFALMQDGELVLFGGTGNYGGPSAMYGIGSTSKMFTTTVIMKLAEDGKLELDATVTRYIPEFTMNDPRYADITVRMLLNHSSGLMGSTLGNSFLWDDNDTRAYDKLLENLSGQRLKADPGAFSVYCNDGFTLAELVAERVTGRDFTSLVHEYITEPLDMENTKTPQDSFDRGLLASIYNPLDPTMLMPSESVNAIGTGGIYSTAQDLCLFGTIFTGEAGILNEKSLAEMMEKEYLKGQWLEAEENIIGYGLGWDSVDAYPFGRYGITALIKGGDTLSYHCSLVVVPEYNLTAAVVSSGGSSSYNQVLATNILLDRLLDMGVIPELIETEAALPEQQPLETELLDYAGIYASSSQLYTVTLQSEGTLTLALTYAPDMSRQYIYCGEGLFMDETGLDSLYFLEQEGNIYLMQEAYGELPGVGETMIHQYVAQKLPENEISDEVLASWEERCEKLYVLASDKYSSVSYSFGLPALGLILSDDAPGYIVCYRFVDENTAVSEIQIPMMNGRDLMDLDFYLAGGVEYVAANGSLYMSQDGFERIYEGAGAISTIQESGYVRWYTIGESLDGRTITVSCPAGAGFMLYDAMGNLVYQSAVSGGNTAVLPAGGYIAFAGEPGAVFLIAIR